MLTAVMLDKGSLDNKDLDFAALESLPLNWQFYHNTHEDELARRIKSADIIVSNKVVINEQVISESNLKLICVAATGVNNIAVAAASKKNIPVCNIRSYATPSVVQHTFMLMTQLLGNTFKYREALSQNRWQESEFFSLFTFPITELHGLTLGIIGYGELGKAVAKMADAYGMKVLVAESFIANENKNHQSSGTDDVRTPLNSLLEQADVISLHCPLTPATADIINASTLRLMKPSAVLINTARGELVDEDALYNAINSAQIAAAGLDVLRTEPPAKENKLLSLSLPNLIITPHIAWASNASRQRLLNELCHNLQSYLNGMIRNKIN